MDLPRRDVNFTCLCHVATWTSHVATSIFTFSVTSRRGLPMSRRQFYRDVDFPRRDVSFYKSLSRREVDHHVATSVFTSLCHVATSPRTSRRHLVICSLTSRRRHERRDVGFITLCHVATSPRTSRRGPILSPRAVHLWRFTSHNQLLETLASPCTCPHRTCRSLFPHWSEALHCSTTTIVPLRVTHLTWFRVIVAFPPHCARF